MIKEDLNSIGLNYRGCRPIFFIEVTAHWRTLSNSQKYAPKVTVQLVHKGLLPLKADDKLKLDFFKKIGLKTFTDTIFKSFKIVSYEVKSHLGYENSPNLK